jgi:DNA-binding response OmpR family regulator
MVGLAVAADKPRVLVVDDSRVVRHTIQRILGNDFQIVQADDGMAGWQTSEKTPVDLVISDINMPQLDGYGLICKIRAADDPRLREVPIIVITSAEDDTVRERAYACGANDFILKPFNASQLLDCVRLHLAGDDSRTTELAQQFGTHVETIVVSDAVGSPDEALAHIEAGLNILRSLKAEQLVPQLPGFIRQCLPFLKYWNTAYALGVEREIAAIEQKLAAGQPRSPATGRLNS